MNNEHASAPRPRNWPANAHDAPSPLYVLHPNRHRSSVAATLAALINRLPAPAQDALRHAVWHLPRAERLGLADVCLAGNPATLGKCGDPDCVCA